VTHGGLHDRLALGSLLVGLPALAVALLLLWRQELEPWKLRAAAAGLVLLWIAGPLVLRARLAYRLRTAANVVAAMREGDVNFRARGGRRDGAFGSLIVELNALAQTLRKHRLDDLESVTLLRNVLGEIDVAVFAFDGEQTLRMLNDAGERLVDGNTSELLGRTAQTLGLAGCLEGEPGRTLYLDLPGGSGRFELRRGTYRHLGRPRTLVILSDVSRTLRAEELDAWKRLIRVMGHELNNSLAPVRSLTGSLTQLIDRDPPPEGWKDDLRSGLRVIGSRAEALNRFLGAYAALARMPEPRMGPVEIVPLVRRAAELERRLPVEVQSGPAVTLSADRDQLEQLLINLIQNAADASLETGGAVRIGWEVRRDRLELLVSDEGPGLTSTTNLFVPFFTTKPEGSGIGLVLCRQVAEAHGGSVTLGNREGARGCEARVRLPLRQRTG
jgi:nitrogen fixation/metabolism regulation signal transduction histidine kinase